MTGLPGMLATPASVRGDAASLDGASLDAAALGVAAPAALEAPGHPDRDPGARGVGGDSLTPESQAAHAALGSHPAHEERVRLYVWQIPVRLTHWVTAGCIVVLSLTGLYIADPFLIPPGGSVMTTVRLVHIVAAITLLISGLVRTIWLLAGNRFARWSAFIPTSRFQATEIFRQAGFYMFIRKEIPKVLGHNQLAAAAYLILFALLLVEVITGFALDGLLGAEPGATLFAWLRELVGPQMLRLVHHIAMWAIIAIALFHVYSCVLVDNLEKSGLMTSIFNGYKYPTREEVLESRDGGPELLEDEA